MEIYAWTKTSGHGLLDQEEAEENLCYFNTFNTPYVAGFSEKLAKDLQNINVAIGMTFWKYQTLYNSFCKLKPPCAQDKIYCLIIRCKFRPQIYLTETHQWPWFTSPSYQHNYAIKKHTKTNIIAHCVSKPTMNLIGETRSFLSQNCIWEA